MHGTTYESKLDVNVTAVFVEEHR